ncbi:MAG TPA: penicillin-binding protein activator LpoB, partial [Nitrospirota bacterium]
MTTRLRKFAAFTLAMLLSGCSVLSGPSVQYRDQNMDFGSITTVAILPMANLSREQMASDRVRDILMNVLLSTGAVYVLPPGEVARGVARGGVTNPFMP